MSKLAHASAPVLVPAVSVTTLHPGESLVADMAGVRLDTEVHPCMRLHLAHQVTLDTTDLAAEKFWAPGSLPFLSVLSQVLHDLVNHLLYLCLGGVFGEHW